MECWSIGVVIKQVSRTENEDRSGSRRGPLGSRIWHGSGEIIRGAHAPRVSRWKARPRLLRTLRYGVPRRTVEGP
jgi:hypothetical protein